MNFFGNKNLQNELSVMMSCNTTQLKWSLSMISEYQNLFKWISWITLMLQAKKQICEFLPGEWCQNAIAKQK